MFSGKKSAKEEEKLSKPGAIPGLVQKYLVTERKMAPDVVELLKAVVRKRTTGETGFNIRVFDESEALIKKIQVKDYASLDEHLELVLYEGWFNETSKQVELQERKKVNWDFTIFTEAEIRQKIEALTEPGSTAFFYLARGLGRGGPLGMGAAVIELNPNYPGNRQKKYNMYIADVVDMQPVGKGEKRLDSDKPKDIASWVNDLQTKGFGGRV